MENDAYGVYAAAIANLTSALKLSSLQSITINPPAGHNGLEYWSAIQALSKAITAGGVDMTLANFASVSGTSATEGIDMEPLLIAGGGIVSAAVIALVIMSIIFCCHAGDRNTGTDEEKGAGEKESKGVESHASWNSGWSTGWNSGQENGRATVTKALLDFLYHTPPYDLHEEVEKLYKETLGEEERAMLPAKRYKRVESYDNSIIRERITTVYEDLASKLLQGQGRQDAPRSGGDSVFEELVGSESDNTYIEANIGSRAHA